MVMGNPANIATKFETGRVMRQMRSLNGLESSLPGRVECLRNVSGLLLVATMYNYMLLLL